MTDSTSVQMRGNSSVPEDAAEQLWRLWQQGREPDVDVFLAGLQPSPGPREIAAILRVDQRERWRRRQSVPVESYIQHRPDLRADPEVLLDLVYAEFLLRECSEQRPDIGEYLHRFPQIADALQAQVALHQALGTDDHAEDPTASGDGIAGSTPNAINHDVPGYEILDVLGRGGMGIVYRGRQRKPRRIVALKLLRAGAHAEPEQLNRFRTEAEAAARLQHPHIVQIFEVGEANHCPYLALEYVNGGDLRSLLHGQPQPPIPAADFVEKVARAVHYAHERGIVHRDLKPANILLSLGSRVPSPESLTRDLGLGTRDLGAFDPKITDFGLAKPLESAAASLGVSDCTQSGALIGTPAYMAPEQALSNRWAIGPAVDVHALGLLLYELLTGRAPYFGETPMQTLQQVITDEPVAPSRLRPGLPRDLETICLKCLQKDPHKRYASALDLAEDLQRFRERKPIHARPVGKTERLWRWCRRNPGVASLATLAALLALVIGIGGVVVSLRLRESGNERLVQLKLAEARVERFRPHIGRRKEALNALSQAAHIHPTADLRDDALAALALFDLRPTGRFRTADVVQDTARFPCRLEIDQFPEPGVGEHKLRRLVHDGQVYSCPGFSERARVYLSEDGQFLAAIAEEDQRVRVWSVAGPKPAVLIEDHTSSLLGVVAFRPDCRQCAIGGSDGMIHLYDLPSGRKVRQDRVGSAIWHIAFDPTGKRLAIGCPWGIQIRDGATGKVQVSLEQQYGVSWLAWHPAGTILAAVSFDGDMLVHGDITVQVWDLATRRRRRVFKGPKSGGTQVQFSRLGDLLLAYDWTATLHIWHWQTGVCLLQATAPIIFDRHDADVLFQRTDASIELFEPSRSPVYRTLRDGVDWPDSNYYRDVSLSPGGPAVGRLLAVATTTGVRLWDLADGTPLGWLATGNTDTVRFDGTGALLTSGQIGLQRWPVVALPGGSKQIQIGPPTRAPVPASLCQVACSQDGRVIAIGRFDNGAAVIDRDHPGRVIALQPQADVRYVDVSPDGRWIATGTHYGERTKIWSSSGGAAVKELPSTGCGVAFSPDGKWLVAGTGRRRLWRVGSWAPGPELDEENWGRGRRFTPDGKIIVVNASDQRLHLVDIASGQVLARLEDPNRAAVHAGAFSLDGGQFIAVAGDGRSVHVWDLRRASAELASLGLKWNWTSTSAPGFHEAATPLKLKIVGEDLQQLGLGQLKTLDASLTHNPRNADLHRQRGVIEYRLGRYDAAVRDLTAALANQRDWTSLMWRAWAYQRLDGWKESAEDLQVARAWKRLSNAQEAEVCNSLAWLYVAGPDSMRRPRKALDLASRAVRLRPANVNYLNTLGVTYYRLGQYDQAIATLRRSLRESQSPAHDLFFLAMSYERLKDRLQAQDCYDEAIYWWQTHRISMDAVVKRELEAFRKEAHMAGLR